jgi:glycosyltransferase involved in cell wall biosynthesis
LFEVLRLLAVRHEVAFYSYADVPGADRHREALRVAGVRIVPPDWLLGLERELLRRIYDAVVFEFWENAEIGAWLVRRAQQWARVVVDSVDVHFLREAGAVAVGACDPATASDNKRRELAAYRSADAVACVSDEDAGHLAAEGIARRFIIPLVIPPGNRASRERGHELLFLVGFRHAPNADGLLWFARECWPAIRAAVPDARLTVVGSDPPAEVSALAGLGGIEVVGQVPETAPYLDRAALMVAPLRYGAGLKSKVVEGLANGLGVVTTSVGAQGLGAVPEEHLAVADQPEDFARAVIGLLGDPARAEEMGRAGRHLVGGTCSPAAVEGRLEAMIGEVVGRGGPESPPIPWRVRSAKYRARRLGSRVASAFGISLRHIGLTPRGLGKVMLPGSPGPRA